MKDLKAEQQIKIAFDPPDDLAVEQHSERIIKLINHDYPVGLRDQDLIIDPDPVEEARLQHVKAARKDHMLGMRGHNFGEHYDGSTEG